MLPGYEVIGQQYSYHRSKGIHGPMEPESPAADFFGRRFGYEGILFIPLGVEGFNKIFNVTFRYRLHLE